MADTRKVWSRRAVRVAVFLCAAAMTAGAAPAPAGAAAERRVPAEWEPQEAIWLQWPGRWEKSHETAFARISNAIARYETLHILAASPAIRADARAAIAREGGDPDHPHIRWHDVASDSAWMRDNGPVWVLEDNALRVQDWGFDAWGGAFGADIPWRLDDNVPGEVARIAGLPVDAVGIVHERGNLEFNGVDTVMLNWSVIGDPRRNPGYTREQAEADLRRHFGVSKVVFIEGVPPGDLTNGHIDGASRASSTPPPSSWPAARERRACAAPGNATARVFDDAARTIEQAGFVVIRDPVDARVEHRGRSFDTNYMNWLVGNGFVIATGFGHDRADAAAGARLETYFPGRDVHVIEMLESWAAGGGVHCHTNDQPAPPASGTATQPE